MTCDTCDMCEILGHGPDCRLCPDSEPEEEVAMDLKEALVRELALMRLAIEIQTEKVADARSALDQIPEWQEHMAAGIALAEMQSHAREVEARLRLEAVTTYDGNKHPLMGIDLAEYQTVTYDRAEAIKWCVGNAVRYLALDTKLFEKAAPVLVDLGAPVKIGVEVRARIASDLSAYLPSDDALDAKVNFPCEVVPAPLPNLGAPIPDADPETLTPEDDTF